MEAWISGPSLTGDPALLPAMTPFGGPEVQEVMRNTLEIANTGAAITQDVGEANDIHPTDKLAVAKRLALAAWRKNGD